MRQGWKVLCCTAAIALIAAAPLAVSVSHAAASKTSSSSAAKKTLRQYTGYVTALDKTSITVEKRGKKTESKVFTRHAEMSVTGELEKSAHVTVYYRDEAGKAIAHRVIVKSETAAAVADH